VPVWWTPWEPDTEVLVTGPSGPVPEPSGRSGRLDEVMVGVLPGKRSVLVGARDARSVLTYPRVRPAAAERMIAA
jgi:hypothetical protein